MITIWTGPGCGPCYALKAKLRAAGVAFTERDASGADAARVARWRALGWSTPVVEHPGGSFSGIIPARVQALVDARR